MKSKHLAGAAIALAIFIIALEKYYKHPTQGNGVCAAIAALRLALIAE
jgi:hypothetical protein